MQTDPYTPGYSTPMLSFMAQRTAEEHARFFLPYLKPGFRVLDAGCGPGSITLGLARAVAPGQVSGINIEDSQFEEVRAEGHREGLNVEFRQGTVYQLPFADQEFDAVYSHAVLEHLSDPAAAIAEFRGVLKPGGAIGLRAGDQGGLLIDADSEGPARHSHPTWRTRRTARRISQCQAKTGKAHAQCGTFRREHVCFVRSHHRRPHEHRSSAGRTIHRAWQLLQIAG